MSAVDNAPANAGEMIDKLDDPIQWSRQAVITNELIEISFPARKRCKRTGE
jgi:F0F1-type ATP synthase gamma subunit